MGGYASRYLRANVPLESRVLVTCGRGDWHVALRLSLHMEIQRRGGGENRSRAGGTVAAPGHDQDATGAIGLGCRDRDVFLERNYVFRRALQRFDPFQGREARH